MNKIAAYELLLEDHPLWSKEAQGLIRNIGPEIMAAHKRAKAKEHAANMADRSRRLAKTRKGIADRRQRMREHQRSLNPVDSSS